MLTMSDEERDLFGAIGAGAHGYVLKDVPAEEVAAAILAVHAGESLIPQRSRRGCSPRYPLVHRVDSAFHSLGAMVK